jgi:hypothetical protein
MALGVGAAVYLVNISNYKKSLWYRESAKKSKPRAFAHIALRTVNKAVVFGALWPLSFLGFATDATCDDFDSKELALYYTPIAWYNVYKEFKNRQDIDEFLNQYSVHATLKFKDIDESEQ